MAVNVLDNLLQCSSRRNMNENKIKKIIEENQKLKQKNIELENIIKTLSERLKEFGCLDAI